MYKNSWGRVCVDKSGQTFEINGGVGQGNPLSSNLFDSRLEEVFQKLNWEGRMAKLMVYGWTISGLQMIWY